MHNDIKNLIKALSHRYKSKPIIFPDDLKDKELDGWLKGFADGCKWYNDILEEELMKILGIEVKLHDA